jgi:copper oxidase (laccase) domain-containing protein
MKRDFGAGPSRMIAAFGPGICADHYEVGPELRKHFGAFVRERNDAFSLDLEGFNRSLLLESGIKEKNIVPAPFCTYERPDLFFSFRRDGKILGEMWALLGMTGPLPIQPKT